MKTFAYLGSSQEGGTYRVFETLRDGLAASGWVGDFISESCLPDAVLNKSEDVILEALRNHLANYDMVIGNVFISVRLMNVLRFLPAKTPRIMIVHNITRATYLAAGALRDHVQRTVAVSPRIRDDLVARGFAPEGVTTIYNAVPDSLFQAPIRQPEDKKVRLLFLGRIEEQSKRVFLIPEMLRSLDPTRYRLTVAGDGPDSVALFAKLRAAEIPFDAPGLIAREDLPQIYCEHDVFLLPSRFEGMPVALSEAMASGLVPVASRLPGITTKVVEDGRSGFLFGQGNTAVAAAHLKSLIDEPSLLRSMREAAHARAQSIFSVTQMLNAYGAAMSEAARAPHIPACDLRRWRPPAAMGPGVRGLLPAGLRQRLANWLLYK